MLYSLLAAWQIIDIALHISMDEMEPLRVIAGTVIVVAATLGAQGITSRPSALIGAGVAYLGLNLAFVVLNGVAYPETGALRLPMLLFVGVTVLLYAAFLRSLRASASAP